MPAITDTFTSIATADLTAVCGGAGETFHDFTNSERSRVATPYRQVVCTTAGIKGAPDVAKGVYGEGASDTDKIRAAEMLKSYCQGGAQLPAQAPKSPF